MNALPAVARKQVRRVCQDRKEDFRQTFGCTAPLRPYRTGVGPNTQEGRRLRQRRIQFGNVPIPQRMSICDAGEDGTQEIADSNRPGKVRGGLPSIALVMLRQAAAVGRRKYARFSRPLKQVPDAVQLLVLIRSARRVGECEAKFSSGLRLHEADSNHQKCS